MGREELFIQRFRDLLMQAKNSFSLLGSRMKYGREEKFIRPCHFRKGVERGNVIRTCPEKTFFIFFFQKKCQESIQKDRFSYIVAKKEGKK